MTIIFLVLVGMTNWLGMAEMTGWMAVLGMISLWEVMATTPIYLAAGVGRIE